jgi:hypothetical protein
LYGVTNDKKIVKAITAIRITIATDLNLFAVLTHPSKYVEALSCFELSSLPLGAIYFWTANIIAINKIKNAAKAA